MGSKQTDSPLLTELLAVHEWLRRDLRQCREIARDVRAGAAATLVKARIQQLRTTGPLWQLRANCLQYCALVQNHHRLEDVMLFPAMRRYAPSLAKVIDRLERDHEEVADLLKEVATAADGLTDSAGDGPHERLATGLDRLAEHLLEHLELEERTLAPVFIQHKLRPDHLS